MAAGKGRPPAKFGKGDIGILNYALTLEYLEAAFYNEATANNKKKTFLKGAQEQAFLKRVTADENAHVAFLKKALGSKAVGGAESRLRRHHRERSRPSSRPRWRWRTPASRAYSGQALQHRQPRLRCRRPSRSGRSRRGTPRSPACC